MIRVDVRKGDESRKVAPRRETRGKMRKSEESDIKGEWKGWR